ncbi:uncharacterized protein PG998_014992 [Apiospora kogelbergensis]|uniref:uncharacterized protein n=1 Tax=Apiospora kogelbergensis TaxID=1337665 RepID=UPI00312F9C2C
MPEKHAEPPSCEAQREREIQRYYQGWLSAHGSALDVALNVNNLAAADFIDVGYEPKYPKDEALAAFAQLAVLCLNVKRAMISLIDKTHQMVLAEATRSLFVGLIGAYAVPDERPRHGLTIEELQFMQGVAQAVMEHLELVQDRVDRFKGERIATLADGVVLFDAITTPVKNSTRSATTSSFRPSGQDLLRQVTPLRKTTGAQVMVFLRLYDHTEERLASACFLWTSMAGRMMNMDEGLPYLRAFSNIMMSELERINTRKREVAKTTFIASMGHELRTPLHGILGATDILIENAADSYQLVGSSLKLSELHEAFWTQEFGTCYFL